MKLKKGYWILIAVLMVVLAGILLIQFKEGDEQSAIKCAKDLYEQKKAEGMIFSSQCLGTCGDYVVDVVHVPRNDEDNLVENQCEDYRSGKVKHFIELDKDGNVVRIV